MSQEQKETIVVIQKQSSTLGIISVIFGVIGIFVLSIIFVPLALLFGILSIIKKQYIWGIVGIIFALIGFATSPMLLSILGLAGAAASVAQ